MLSLFSCDLEACQGVTFISYGNLVCEKYTKKARVTAHYVFTDALYAWIDTRYADMEDTFGLAQTW